MCMCVVPVKMTHYIMVLVISPRDSFSFAVNKPRWRFVFWLCLEHRRHFFSEIAFNRLTFMVQGDKGLLTS